MEETILLHPYSNQLKQRIEIYEDAERLKEKIYKYINSKESYTKKDIKLVFNTLNSYSRTLNNQSEIRNVINYGLNNSTKYFKEKLNNKISKIESLIGVDDDVNKSVQELLDILKSNYNIKHGILDYYINSNTYELTKEEIELIKSDFDKIYERLNFICTHIKFPKYMDYKLDRWNDSLYKEEEQ